MSKIVFVSPSNTAKMLLTEAMVRYAHADDTLVFVDAASKGDLDANIAALAANQDIIYVACNISDSDTGITVAQGAALNAKLKAVTGELINFTSTDQVATRDMAWQAWEELFGTDVSKPMVIYYTSELLGILTPTEEAYGVYLKNAIKARYYGNLGTEATLEECLSILDWGFVTGSIYRPAYVSQAPSPVVNQLVVNDLLNEGLAIYNYDQAKSDYIYMNSFTIDADGETWIGVIDELAGTIDVAIPYGEAVTALVPDFVASDFAKVYIVDEEQESGVSDQDFTNPVNYVVLAEAGGVNIYEVTVTTDGGSAENDILTFTVPTQVGDTVIDDVNHTVAINVPNDTKPDPSSLIATFTVSDKVYSVRIAETPQVSGVTANDFTNPVQYDVRAQDGTVQAWEITVAVLPA
jgi:hypothetical protein